MKITLEEHEFINLEFNIGEDNSKSYKFRADTLRQIIEYAVNTESPEPNTPNVNP